jgi:DNA invertase Pin-like site-specific DNA recombinase
MRCAVYARFSSDLQRETSIDDQLAAARRFADARGWAVLDAHVYTDHAVSGSSLDRPGIRALLGAVAQKPIRFDVLLVDDSSRVSRNVADAVRFMENLTFASVRVIYISQNIDSSNEQAETLAAVHGIVDSLYLREMAKKTQRGLAGQLERGYATGSRTYGYRTVPVPNPDGKAKHGRAAMHGSRIEIAPDEARVIVQIYRWFAEGMGVRRITELLNRGKMIGPRGAMWKHGAVRRVLENEKYTGQLIWGQRRHVRKPGSKARLARMLPRHQWHILDRPDLRIVEQELWRSVQQRHAEVRATLPTIGTRRLMRGRNAALYSPHVFSGFMTCAECGASISIQSTHRDRSPRYGCTRSWRNGPTSCRNRLTISAPVLERNLLAGLQAELVKPATIRHIADALATELSRRTDDRPSRETELKAAREQAARAIRRLVAAIEDGAPAAALTTRIRERETELQRLDRGLAELSEPWDDRLAVMPTWVEQQLQDLVGLLGESVERTKAELRRIQLSVKLQPVRRQGRAFYRAHCRADLPWLSGDRDFAGLSTDASPR